MAQKETTRIAIVKVIVKLIASYIILRLLLFIGLVSGLIFTCFRYVIGLYLSHKYKQPIKFVKAQDAKYCIDGKQLQLYQLFKGTVDMEKFRQRIIERWLQPQFDNGRWKHLKLRLQVEQEFGYYFWIPIKQQEFRIENHVMSCNGSDITNKNDLSRFCAQNSSNLVKNGIFWQFILLDLPDNFENNNTKQHLIFFQCHHALMDPFSMNKMYNLLFDDDISNDSVIYKPKTRSTRKISFWIHLFAYTPYQFIRELLKKEEKHLLQPSSLTGTHVITISRTIPLNKFKDIEKAINCTTNEILIACVAGAIRSYFSLKNEQIPFEMSLQIPISFQTSRGKVKMENNVTAQRISAPINDSTRLARVNKSKCCLDHQMTPILYFTHLYFKFYINRFPLCLTKRIVKRFSSSAICCLQISSPKTLTENKPLEQLVCLSEGDTSRSGFAVTFNVDEENVVFVIKGDVGVLESQENVDELGRLVEKEFKEFCCDFGYRE